MLLFSLLLAACQPSAGVFSQPLAVGSLWAAPAGEGKLDFNSAAPQAREQHAGYLLGSQNLTDPDYAEKAAAEGNQADDVQVAVRRLVEEEKVVALIGATSNEATMRAASLVNFFNVPMLIPTAGGDNLLPSANLWAFRLSAPASAYAGYLFDTLMVKPVESGSAVVTPGLRVALIYEENTFGENAAVAAAQAAMRQQMEIVLYSSFSSQAPDPERIRALATSALTQGAQLVLLVSNEPDVALTLVRTFRNVYSGKGLLPMLVGQAGAFASAEFLQTGDAEGVYVLRQKLERAGCPAAIDSIYAAQTYAAVSLLDQAARQVKDSLPVQNKWERLLPNRQEPPDTLPAVREKLRNAIRASNYSLPCIGPVAFDNSGQNKLVRFELVQVSGGEVVLRSTEEFQKELLIRVKLK